MKKGIVLSFATVGLLFLNKREFIKKSAGVFASVVIAINLANADDLKIGKKIDFPIKKEYKVSKISEVKKICADVAEDIDGGKYLLNIPTTLYEKYKNDIIKNFPNDDGCTFVMATRKTKTSPNTEVIYTSAFGDTDASDIVAKETAEAEQAKKQADLVWDKVKAKEQQVKAKGYLGYLQKKIIYLLNENITKEEAIQLLRQVNSELKLGTLRGNKYAKNIKSGLETIKLKYGNDKNVNKYVDSILKKLHLNY